RYYTCVTVAAICHVRLLFFFFFFQAEDGIRYWSVTGVQTCALPILDGNFALKKIADLRPHVVTLDLEMPGLNGIDTLKAIMRKRSEERRVGKECRYRGSRYN